MRIIFFVCILVVAAGFGAALWLSQNTVPSNSVLYHYYQPPIQEGHGE